MEPGKTLYDIILESLAGFCRLSIPEVEAYYPQRLDDELKLGNARNACYALRASIKERFVDVEKSDVERVLCGVLDLRMTINELLWLQQTILTAKCPDIAAVSYCNRQWSVLTPTMNINSLIAEIEECAWYILDQLDSSNKTVCSALSR